MTDRDVKPDNVLDGRVPLARAGTLAVFLVDELRPACERIEIAGSIRRRKPTVKDIELVAIPKMSRDLFGELLVDEPTELDLLVDRLVADGRLAPRLNSAGGRCMGSKMKRLVAVRSGIAVDLFAVTPPAQWGAIFAIRTGPADFSEWLVTICQRRGLRCVEGRLVDAQGREIPTPEERDFIDACGAQYVEPWERR